MEKSSLCIQISKNGIMTKEGYNMNCSGGTIKCSDIVLTNKENSKENRQFYTISAQDCCLDLVAASVYSKGTFYTQGGTISVSDQRLKTDIADVDDSAVDLILSLQPKNIN